MKISYRVALVTTIGLIVAGTLLLAVNALTFQYATYRDPNALTSALLKKLGVPRSTVVAYLRQHPEAVFQDTSGDNSKGGRALRAAFRDAQRSIQSDAVARSRRWTAIAIGALAVVAGLIGLLASRRLLRPIRTITESARRASADDLSARVALEGPDDELKELSDTFDSMLERLDRSFAAQRRFSAQVSHELRTPLAVARTEADNILAGDEEPENAARNIREAIDRARAIIDSLLALSRADGKPFLRSPLRVDLLVGDVMGELAEDRSWDRVTLDLDLHETWISADRALIDCAVRNLAENALRHAGSNGRVGVYVGREDNRGRWAVIDFTNSLEMNDPTSAAGHGIGLTVVEAVADAHGGRSELDVQDREARARLEIPHLASMPLESVEADGHRNRLG
jgi:signal transduction histidine kinase